MLNLLQATWLSLGHQISTTLALYATIVILLVVLIFKQQRRQQLQGKNAVFVVSCSSRSSSSSSSSSPVVDQFGPSKHLGSSTRDPRPATNQRRIQLKQMPSPPAMPIIGHMHLLRDYQHNPWEGFSAIGRQYGDVVSLRMGIQTIVLVSSLDATQEILLKKSAIFADRPSFPRHHIIFGGDKENSLALCNWSFAHRDRRKLCKRGIFPSKISSRNQLLESIVCQQTVKFVQDLSQHHPQAPPPIEQQPPPPHSPLSTVTNSLKSSISSNPIPLLPQFTHHPHHHRDHQEAIHTNLTKLDILVLTQDIFMEFLCSDKYSRDSQVYRDFAKGCDFVFWDINQSYLIDFLPYLTSLGLGYSYLKRLKDETDFLRNFIDDEIFDPRLAMHKRHGANERSFFEASLISANDNNSEEYHRSDYLDSLILEYLSKTTLMSLADYKVGFADLLAGHAAVANILIRVLGHLALDENIQDMIRDEAEQADLVNATQKPLLPITEAALLEALRLASSPIVPHVARENTSVSGFFVPTGSMVLFNTYQQNLSEENWKNPHQYDPLRFIDKRTNELGQSQTKLNVPKHFLPFSVGMRQCLGQRMVETTTIIAVANLCRQFIIKPNKEHLVRELLEPKGCLALNPDVECFELKLFAR